MDYNFLMKTPLFKGINEKEAEEVLKCLQTRQQNYKKNDIIFHAGKQVEAFGLVLYGSVTIENDDIWGNKNILDNIVAGQLFAETYACLSEEHLMVHVVALEDCSILLLNREEEKISKKKVLELFENNILEQFEIGKFVGLVKIHKYLFR